VEFSCPPHAAVSNTAVAVAAAYTMSVVPRPKDHSTMVLAKRGKGVKEKCV